MALLKWRSHVEGQCSSEDGKMIERWNCRRSKQQKRRMPLPHTSQPWASAIDVVTKTSYHSIVVAPRRVPRKNS